MTKNKRIYKIDKLPYSQNLSKFSPSYTPEKFTKEEIRFLKPFFSNVDKPLFVVQHLPEEVIGALSSRYSRATKSLRRMFLDEYIKPIIKPEEQKDWGALSIKQKNEARQIRKNLLTIIEILNKGGGIEEVVNVQRGRKFFDTWLAQYGDDSIAEMGGVHLCVEGVSNVVIKEMQDKRIGISPLEKSSRYVQFWDKRADGEYQYIVPGEIKKTPLEKEYRKTMDLLFDTYSQIAQEYLEYIKNKYPKGDDETDRSFEGSRSAKRFDDIRDLLPFSTQTSFAMFGNGRAFEDLINRLLNHSLGEARWWGQAICDELDKAVPSFVTRPKTLRGAEMQAYRSNLLLVKDEVLRKFLGNTSKKYPRWSKLVSFTPNPEVEVLSTFLFGASLGVSLTEIRKKVLHLSNKKRGELFVKILAERKFGKKDAPRQEVRFRKVPRSFENAHFEFEVWARGGDYRDLHRHRQLTQERQRFNTFWGYDLEKEVYESPYIEKFEKAFRQADILYKKVLKISPDVAQYVVPFGFVQHWYIGLTAREIYWISELRTGPQGREHYRQICQDIARQATSIAPNLFSGMMTDWGSYALSRRESEKKIDKKLQALEAKR